MKKTKFCLIRNCILSGILFLPGTIYAEVNVYEDSISTHASYSDTRADDKADAARYLLVWDNNGGFVKFPLEERPRIVCDYEMNSVKCITSTEEISFAMDKVHKYTLHANPDELVSVEEVTESKGSFRSDADSFSFENFKPGSNVSVYTINGMLVHSYIIDNDGRLTISTSGLGEGIYLLKTESVTYKVVKK